MCAEAAKIAKGEAASLKIGYLRTYAGGEFHRALAAFRRGIPTLASPSRTAAMGELCDMLSEDRVEITLNDQRRLFSDAYENLILAARPALIEVSAHSPIAQMEAVAPAELKNFPCILIAPPPEREAEQNSAALYSAFQVNSCMPRIWRRRAFWSRAAGDFFRWRAAKGRRPNRLPACRSCETVRRFFAHTARSGKRRT